MASKALISVAALLTEEDDSDDDSCIASAAMLSYLCQTPERFPRTRIMGYMDVVAQYNNEEFRRLFRMSRDTFVTVLNYLKECPELLVKGEGGRDPISVEKQLLLTLWYFGGTDSVIKLADRFGISESSVILSRTRVMNAILNQLMPRFITWPEDNADCIRKFSIRNGFPGVLGALDGTHIPIKAPKDNPQRYVNRKKFHSLQLQAVCNADMLFTDSFCGYPGSCHDSRVLKLSPLWENGPQLCNGNHILADGGYPLRSWLLTPFRDNGHLTEEEKNFNYLLSSNRVVVERAFGLLKGRFRRLRYIDTQSITTAVKIIMSACVLHNICLLNNEEIEEFMEMDDGHDGGQLLNIPENGAEGQIKRNMIARQLFRH